MVKAVEKIWLKNYPPKVRTSLEYPDISMTEVLYQRAKDYPDNTAIIFADQQINYRTLAGMVSALANALQNQGIQKGDRIALMMPNCPQFVIAYFAIFQVGGIVVQTNPMYLERELEYQLKDSGAKGIMLLDMLLPRILAVQANTQVNLVISAAFGPRQETLPEGVLDFGELMKKYPGQPTPVVVDNRNDVVLLQYTGGTTGSSKGVMLTHSNLMANMLQVKEWFLGQGPGQECIMGVLPFFHVFGMTACMNFAIYEASSMILHPRFDAKAVLDSVIKYKPTVFPAVPTMYVALNNHPETKAAGMGDIRICMSGGAALPIEVLEQFESLTGGTLVEAYGLSETSPAALSNPIKGIRKPGSIGIPFPDTEYFIADLETGEPVPMGMPGEIVVRGPQVFKGYWQRPEETAAVLKEGWFFTGDIGRMDEDGYCFIIDRKKDLIISGGFNIYPRDVEEVIYEHPKVLEVAVVGHPDSYLGEKVMAYVVAKPGETITAEEVITFCRDKMAAYKVPREVEFLKEIPKSAVGKILRRLLHADVLGKAE
ncbi:MAG: long-chain-fatty-acid--CoA ligase [Carboxydocellales bacterium]